MEGIARGELNNLRGSVGASSMAPRAPGRLRPPLLRDPVEILQAVLSKRKLFERGADAMKRTIREDRIRLERARAWALRMRFPRRYRVPDMMREDARDRGHVIWARYSRAPPNTLGKPPAELLDVLEEKRGTELLAVVQTNEWRTAPKVGRDGYTVNALRSAYAWPEPGDVVRLRATGGDAVRFVLVHDLFVNRGGAGTVALCVGTVTRRRPDPLRDGYSASELRTSSVYRPPK